MGEAARRPSGHRRRAHVIAGILAAFVLLVAALVVWNMTGVGEPAPAVTSTTTAPAPTTTVAAVAHDQSAFTQAQPGTVLDYALTDIRPLDEDIAALPDRPVEAWLLTYASSEHTVELEAVQWPGAQAATVAFDAVAPEGREELDGVTVGGSTVGEMWLGRTDDSHARVSWRNTTAVFTVTGPADVVETFARAYPM